MLKRCLWIIGTVLCLAVITATPIYAATTSIITITATPGLGVLTFTATYISDTQVQLDWTVSPEVDKVMIRASYGSEPDDIPDEDTAPSDGYLVYYDAGLSANDTSMDFDQNPGPLYYKAWAQKVDGKWYTTSLTDWKESKTLALIAIVLLCALVSYLSIRSSNILLALGASITWIFLLVYTRDNPITGVTTGTFADELIIYLCWIFVIVLPLTAFVRGRREKRYFGEGGGSVEWGESREVKPRDSAPQPRGMMDEDTEAYRTRVKQALRNYRK